MRRIKPLYLLYLRPPPQTTVTTTLKPYTTTQSTTPKSQETPSLYSFLEPTLFPPKNPQKKPQINPTTTTTTTTTISIPQDDQNALHASLHASITSKNTDDAWKTFKTLMNNKDITCLPSKSLTNDMILHLVSFNDVHNLKRAFVSLVFLIEKNPSLLEFSTVRSVLECLCSNNAVAPCFALVKSMFNNRCFVPFSVWGDLVVEISRKAGSFICFLGVFHESCRVVIEERLEFMKPGLSACNAALEGCCFELESVGEAEKVVELMSVFRVRPDEVSFGFLGYLYALKGLEGKVVELEDLMSRLGLEDRLGFVGNLIRGYVKAGRIESVTRIVVSSLREGGEEGLKLSGEVCCDVVKGFLKHGGIKDLAALVVEAQSLETESVVAERSVGFGVVNACVELGMLDKAHSVMDEIVARGASIGIGVYLSILRAYCKEQRTAEAAQLVSQIKDADLQLDPNCYDSLIEASMSSQDFQSAFSIFRNMRDSRVSELKTSYLTIMTGLTENNRPELMAAFLDEVMGDPRIEVGTHDWNSIIHAFSKAGRMEDARRTFRRMTFLQYAPNGQTYLSMINGNVTEAKYFNVMLLWNDAKKQLENSESTGFKLDHSLTDAFLYAMVKGGFFDTVMQIVETSQGMKIFVDKWRYKHAFMENHKKLSVPKLKRRNVRKMEALIAFKTWVGLNV